MGNTSCMSSADKADKADLVRASQGTKLKPEIITYKGVIDACAKSTVLLSMHGDGCRVVIRWHFKT